MSEVWEEEDESGLPRCWRIVWRGNQAKFTQNPELLQLLLDTRGTTLAEASPTDCIGCRSASVMRLPSQQGARRGTLSGGVPGNPLRVPNC